jgi:hypothetical protein
MPKISRPPSVATLIDRHTRALNAMRARLALERDPARLAQLRKDIAEKAWRVTRLQMEQTTNAPR